jgi:hypothetical protein
VGDGEIPRGGCNRYLEITQRGNSHKTDIELLIDKKTPPA